MNLSYERILAGALLCLHLLASAVLAELPSEPLPRIGVEFDQELFELAHSVFLANTNLAEALSVTERAIQARPTDKVWRTKGAQTAEWAGRFDLALQHWLYLARTGDTEANRSALRISRSMNELPIRKQLLEQTPEFPSSLEIQKEYLAVLEGMGLPDEAYNLLASGKLLQQDPFLRFTEMARLAENLGRPADTFAAWEKRAALKPLNSEESLKVAALWIGQGNAAQALTVLSQTAPETPDAETSFWRMYTDLAWTLQEIPEAVAGAERLIRTGTATEADYRVMLMAFQESDPARAYSIASTGWQMFEKPEWWYSMVETGLRSGHSNDLLILYKNMTPHERDLLSRDWRSWDYLARIYRQTGDPAASLAAARIAFRYNPDNVGQLISYIWLLIDLKNTTELHSLVGKLEPQIIEFPELREPLAVAMVLLGEPWRALPHYRIIARGRQEDPVWLTSYADVLEQAGHYEAAWSVRRQAYRLILRQIRSGQSPPETKRQELLTRTQLMMNLQPGDDVSVLIRRIAGTSDVAGKELVMAWAMSTGQTDLARFWYWRTFARTTQRLEWAELGLALEENDRPEIADLIEAHCDHLPYRDTVEGARKSGMVGLAGSHAFEKLEVNPEDYLLDQQFRDLSSSRPGYVRYTLTLEDYAGVGWVQNKIAVSQPLSARYSISGEISARQFSLLKSTALDSVPGHDSGGSLTLTRQHEQGYLSLSLGVSDGGLHRFETSAVEVVWQPYHDLNLSGRIDYNGRAEESAPLSVAGLRDRFRLLATGTLTPMDTLSLELAAMRYRDQQRNSLGDGTSAFLDVRHQIRSTWPDFGVRGYGGYTATNAGGTLSADMAALLPANAEQSTSFFVPQSFGQFGVGAFIGQSWKSVYTRDFKPFADLDASWSTTAGFGVSYGAGIVGPVMGLDQIKLELRQIADQSGLSGLTSIIELEYRYFF